MDEPIGLRIWSEFTRLRNAHSEQLRSFGKLAVSTILHAGDGGTFACHVKEKVKKGSWSLHRICLDDLGVILALHDGSEPLRWEFAGGIIIDSSVGTILPAASLKEILALEDGDDFTDTIDEALFGSDDDEAVIETPNGKKLAVFQLGGDGTYNVFKGLDSLGAVCALAVEN